MSRITGNDAKGLMEAYAEIYTPQEEVELTEEQIQEGFENWVNSLVEEGYDLSEYTSEELYEVYITEIGVNFGGQAAVDRVRAQAAAERKSASRIDALRQQRFGSGGSPSAGKGAKTRAELTGSAKPTAPAPVRPVTPAAPAPVRPATPAAPAAPTATKPTPAATPAPAPKGDAMSQWAKANPKLAAASAERARTRGTSATTNPLMKDMASRLPAPTPVVKPVTPTAAVSAAPSSSPAASGSVAPATAKIAAKPSSAMSQDAIRARRLNMEMEYDAYDLVLEYLTSEGHVETVDEALYVMMEMDAETIQSICNEELTGERKERAEKIMKELRPHGKPRKATNKKYGALSRVTRASEGSSDALRTRQTSPTKRGGRMPKGSVKTGWDGDFQADRPKG